LFRTREVFAKAFRDGKSLESTYLGNMLMLSWIVHLMKILGMCSFASLKRRKKLPYKRGRRSKKMKNATILFAFTL